jgi:hypothetical protein
MTRWMLASALLLLASSPQGASQDSAAVKKVVLVELFTSQG